jgi:hypothetical protein
MLPRRLDHWLQKRASENIYTFLWYLHLVRNEMPPSQGRKQ